MGHDKINELYNNIESPFLYASPRKLYNKLKTENITQQDIKDYLAKQDSYTLHFPVIKKFKRNQYRVFNIDELWEVDLCDMKHFKNVNDNYSFILTVIDVFSKFAFARPLRTKSAKDVTIAFMDILNSSGRKPQIVQSDHGKEFKNISFSNMLASNNIKQYFSYNPTLKCAVVERFNRTLKQLMYKYFTHRNTKRYVDVLQHLLYVYNNNVHSTIKMKPSDVTDSDILILNKIYREKHENLVSKIKTKQTLLKKNDIVRVAKPRASFDRGFEQRWTEEKFMVDKIINKIPFALYTLRDFKNTPITGRFYGKQLQKVHSVLPPIEKIIKTRGLGKNLHYLVRFSNDKTVKWISKSEIAKHYGVSDKNK